MKNIHAVFLAAMVITTGSIADEAQADLGPAVVTNAVAKVQLTCSYGASDVARVYHVQNKTGKVILKGAKIQAESTLTGTYPNDKRAALLTLLADLQPMQSIELVKTGQTNGGTCKAWIEDPGKPDLVITSVAWAKSLVRPGSGGTPQDAVRITVKNRNPFASAVASKTRAQSMSCTPTVVTTVLIDTPAIAGGASTSLLHPLSRQYPAHWLRAYANATNTVPESDKTNNSKDEGYGTCVN